MSQIKKVPVPEIKRIVMDDFEDEQDYEEVRVAKPINPVKPIKPIKPFKPIKPTSPIKVATPKPEAEVIKKVRPVPAPFRKPVEVKEELPEEEEVLDDYQELPEEEEFEEDIVEEYQDYPEEEEIEEEIEEEEIEDFPEPEPEPIPVVVPKKRIIRQQPVKPAPQPEPEEEVKKEVKKKVKEEVKKEVKEEAPKAKPEKPVKEVKDSKPWFDRDFLYSGVGRKLILLANAGFIILAFVGISCGVIMITSGNYKYGLISLILVPVISYLVMLLPATVGKILSHTQNLEEILLQQKEMNAQLAAALSEKSFGDLAYKPAEPEAKNFIEKQEEEKARIDRIKNGPFHDEPIEDTNGAVKVISVDGKVNFYNEYLKISDGVNCLVSDADETFYHTNMSCVETWPQTQKAKFTHWNVISKKEAELRRKLSFCPTCRAKDTKEAKRTW